MSYLNNCDLKQPEYMSNMIGIYEDLNLLYTSKLFDSSNIIKCSTNRMSSLQGIQFYMPYSVPIAS